MSRRICMERRRFFAASTFGAALFTSKGLMAELLQETAFQTEGPFYPDRLPLDTDNDLLIINDELTPAIGEVTHLTGRLLDTEGRPLKNAVVEIWQVNAQGSYIHSRSGNRENNNFDPNFQGFGRFLTGSTGEYYFRTIKPVAYPGRTPHIHFKVKRAGAPDFTTQCYIEGEPRNQRDGVLRGIADEKEAWNSVMVKFQPLPDSKLGELAAQFNIVIGVTPEDEPQHKNSGSRDSG